MHHAVAISGLAVHVRISIQIRRDLGIYIYQGYLNTNIDDTLSDALFVAAHE